MFRNCNSSDEFWFQKINDLYDTRFQTLEELYGFLFQQKQQNQLQMNNNHINPKQAYVEIYDVLKKDIQENQTQVRSDFIELLQQSEDKQKKELKKSEDRQKEEFAASLKTSEEKLKKEFAASLKTSEEKLKKEFTASLQQFEEKQKTDQRQTQSTSGLNSETTSSMNNSHQLVGLTNTKLNCYMNAALQALSASKHLVNAIQEWSSKYPSLIKLSCLNKLLNNLNEKTGRNISLVDNDLFKDWNKEGMQDSFEFIAFMMNQVIKEVKSHRKLSQGAWLREDFPMIIKLVYSTMCSESHTEESPVQTDLVLHLSLPDNDSHKSYSLPELIRFSMEGEQVSDYTCQESCLSRNGIKFTKLLEPPSILCLHLVKNITNKRRYQYKSRVKVTLENEGLTLFRNMFVNEDFECSYRLCSTIDHMGSLDVGHFKGFKRIDEKWFLINDTSISNVTFEKVKNSELYFLVYELQKKENVNVQVALEPHNPHPTTELSSRSIDGDQVIQRTNMNIILHMLLSSDEFIKVLTDVNQLSDNPKLSKLWKAMKELRDSGYQNLYFDDQPDKLDMFRKFLTSINDEWDKFELQTKNTNRNISNSSNPFTTIIDEELYCSKNHFNSSKEFHPIVLSIDVPKNAKSSNGKLNFQNIFDDYFRKKTIKSQIECQNKAWCSYQIDHLQRILKYAPKILFIILRRSDKEDHAKLTIESEIKLKYSCFTNYYKLKYIVINKDDSNKEFIGFMSAKSVWIMNDGNGNKKEINDDSIRDIEPLILMYQYQYM